MAADYSLIVAERRCWVVEDNGRIPGMVQTAPTAGYLEVETIAVAPDAQGHGIGAQLLGFAEEQAHAAGLPEIRLYTNEAMTEISNTIRVADSMRLAALLTTDIVGFSSQSPSG